MKNQSTFPLYLSIDALSIKQKALQDLVPTYSRLSLYNNRTVGNNSFEGFLSGWHFTQGINLGRSFGLVLDIMHENITNNGYEFDKNIERLFIFQNIDNNRNTKFRFTIKRHLWFPDIDFLWCLYVKRFYLTFLYEEYGNIIEPSILNQKAFGIGLTTEFGGIATIRANFPLTVFYYYNIETKAKGLRFSI